MHSCCLHKPDRVTNSQLRSLIGPSASLNSQPSSTSHTTNLRRAPKGLIGLRIATAWLACCVQARCGQARRVREVLDWFAYAYIQTWFRHCLAACTSNAKVNFCVCTFVHAHSHALALAPSEPGSRETVDSLVPPEPG